MLEEVEEAEVVTCQAWKDSKPARKTHFLERKEVWSEYRKKASQQGVLKCSLAREGRGQC